MRLEDWLKRNNVTRDDFAGRIGVTPSALSRYINGRRTPTLEVAAKIVEATEKKVHLEDLIGVQPAGDGAR